eukprot:Skav202021  [mRNA]  locus=scaffold1138:116594:119245:+ [translate_table: standard]
MTGVILLKHVQAGNLCRLSTVRGHLGRERTMLALPSRAARTGDSTQGSTAELQAPLAVEGGRTVSARDLRPSYDTVLFRCCCGVVRDYTHLLVIIAVALKVTLMLSEILDFSSQMAERKCRTSVCLGHLLYLSPLPLSLCGYFKFLRAYRNGNDDDVSLQQLEQTQRDWQDKALKDSQEQQQQLSAIVDQLCSRAVVANTRTFEACRDSFLDFLTSNLRSLQRHGAEEDVRLPDEDILQHLRYFAQVWCNHYADSFIVSDSNDWRRRVEEAIDASASVEALCDTVQSHLGQVSTNLLPDTPIKSYIPHRPSNPSGDVEAQMASPASSEILGSEIRFHLLFGSITFFSKWHLIHFMSLLIDFAAIVYQVCIHYPFEVILLTVVDATVVVVTLREFKVVEKIGHLLRNIRDLKDRYDHVRRVYQQAVQRYELVQTKLESWEEKTIPSLLLMQAIHHALKDQRSLLDDLRNGNSLIQETLNESGTSAAAAKKLLQQKGLTQAVASLQNHEPGKGQQGMLGPC